MAIKVDLELSLVQDIINAKLAQLKRKQVTEFNAMIKEIIQGDINKMTDALRTLTVIKDK